VVFNDISAHEGSLTRDSPSNKGSSYDVLIAWEEGSRTFKPLRTIAADNPAVCAVYAERAKVLDTDGWKQFRQLVKRPKVLDVDRVHAEHLLSTLRSLYNITTDWIASVYCGITLKWDYTARTVNLSMPGYIEKALKTYLHKRFKSPQHAPHAWTAKGQLTPPADNSKPLDAGGLTRIQRINGTLLFYGRAINNTQHVALGTLSAARSKEPKQQPKPSPSS